MKNLSAAKWLRRPLCALCLLVLLVQLFRVGILANTRDQLSSDAETAFFDGEEVYVKGIVQQVQEKESVTAVVLSGCTLSSDAGTFTENKILLYLTDMEAAKEIKIGSVFCAEGEKDSFSEARNEGNFDQKLYYRRKGIHILLWVEEIESCTAETTGVKKTWYTLRNSLQSLRETWADSLTESLGTYYGETMKAVLLGDKSGLDEDAQTLYRTNGVGHILAISGLHMSFIGLGVYRVGRRLGLTPAPAGVFSAVILFLYYLMVGPGVSGTRALYMFLFRMGADVTGRDYDLPTALAVSAAVSAVRQPLVLTDAGFLLSYGAILGLYFFSPVFTAAFARKTDKDRESLQQSGLSFAGRKPGMAARLFPRLARSLKGGKPGRVLASAGQNVRSAFCASLSVSLVLLGPLLWFYFETPLYSVFLNILVIPLMPPAMAAGIVGLFIGLLFPAAGSMCLQVCRGILMLCDALCEAASALPAYRIVTGRQSIFWLVVYYAVLAGVLLWHRAAMGRAKKENIPDTVRKEKNGCGESNPNSIIREGNGFGEGKSNTINDFGEGKSNTINNFSERSVSIQKARGETQGRRREIYGERRGARRKARRGVRKKFPGRFRGKICSWFCACVRHRRVPGIFAVCFMLLMIFACRFGNQLVGGAETTFLDVGQGDCICIRGPSGSTYLVDGGSTDVSDVGTWRIKPYLLANGIDTLDYVFATHGDEDHISGIEELLAAQKTGVKIKNLVLPSETYIDDSLAELAELAAQNGTRVLTMNPGEQIMETGVRIGIGSKSANIDGSGSESEGGNESGGGDGNGSEGGNESGDGDGIESEGEDADADGSGSKGGSGGADAADALVITCLGPLSGAGLESGNEASLILDVTYGDFSMLLAGDVEDDGEEDLIASPLLQTYDVYKVAHHGSKYTSSAELLSAITPTISVISCGEDNIYGHPHEETLERLAAVGSKVFVTMESGQIRVRVKNGAGKMTVSAYIQDD